MKSYSMTYRFYYYPSPTLANFCQWRVKNDSALCVQMDFTRTFQTNTKCNNINHVWSHFYKVLVVLKSMISSIFDKDTSRCINTNVKVVYLAFSGIFMFLQMFVSKILAHRHLWYFRTAKLLQKILLTWFVLFHLVLVWNVHVKYIWTHSGGGVTGYFG